MKNYIKILLLAASAAVLASCVGGGVNSKKPSSQGAPYEIIVIAAPEKWEGMLGDTLRNILLQEVEMINSREPIFDVVRVLPGGFKGLITKHRNILNINTGTEYPEPRITASYDVYAYPQIFVNITGPHIEAITEYVSAHRSELQSVFSIAERDRAIAFNARYADKTLRSAIFDKFGFNINLPKGFRIRNTLDEFMWLSMEHPQSSQGVVIYRYPYTGIENFEPNSLFERRNEFVSLIPGENPGSYMITYAGFPPLVDYMRINGRPWVRMRGFWDVQGDFMGGPFISYSTVDTATQNIVTIDCYVYSPSPYKHKRNYLRELENLVYSVSFASDAAQGGQ